MDVPRTEAVCLPEGLRKQSAGLFPSFLAQCQASLPGSMLKTVPKSSRRAVFWWLGFLVWFCLGFFFFFFLPLMPPSNMLLVLKTAVASCRPLSLPPCLPPSFPGKQLQASPPLSRVSPSQGGGGLPGNAAGPRAHNARVGTWPLRPRLPNICISSTAAPTMGIKATCTPSGQAACAIARNQV